MASKLSILKQEFFIGQINYSKVKPLTYLNRNTFLIVDGLSGNHVLGHDGVVGSTLEVDTGESLVVLDKDLSAGTNTSSTASSSSTISSSSATASTITTATSTRTNSRTHAVSNHS